MTLESGEIAWAELDPVKGTEQGGRRPALVISSERYNRASSRVLICPISTNTGNWPFNVPLPEGLRTKGVVLVDQVRSVDRSERVFRFIERAPVAVLNEVRDRLAALLVD